MASKFVHFSICDRIVHFLYRQFYALHGKWFTGARFRRRRGGGGGLMVIDCILTTLLHSYSLCVCLYIHVCMILGGCI